MNYQKTYQSILNHLSTLPLEYLKKVDQFLEDLRRKTISKEKNRKAIMDLAGSWSDWEEEEFKQFMETIHSERSKMFNRQIEL